MADDVMLRRATALCPLCPHKTMHMGRTREKALEVVSASMDRHLSEVHNDDDGDFEVQG